MEIASHAAATTTTRRAASSVLRFAAGLSLAFHLALIVWFALFGITRPAQIGRSAPPPAPAAILTEQQLEQSVATQLSLSLPQVDINAFDNAQVDAELSDLSLEALPNLSSEVAPGTTGEGDAAGLGEGGAGSGSSASFFGVEAAGQRFAFILDFSSSMTSGGRIDTLRTELRRSLESLSPTAEFRILLFSDEHAAIDITGGDWQLATQQHRHAALRLVHARSPGGGTEPLPAFELLFDVRPAPDALYFMTDGDFRVDGEADVQDAARALLRVRRAARARSVVHTVLLGASNADLAQAMRLIAQQTGGRFQHVRSQSP